MIIENTNNVVGKVFLSNYSIYAFLHLHINYAGLIFCSYNGPSNGYKENKQDVNTIHLSQYNNLCKLICLNKTNEINTYYFVLLCWTNQQSKNKNIKEQDNLKTDNHIKKIMPKMKILLKGFPCPFLEEFKHWQTIQCICWSVWYTFLLSLLYNNSFSQTLILILTHCFWYFV